MDKRSVKLPTAIPNNGLHLRPTPYVLCSTIDFLSNSWLGLLLHKVKTERKATGLGVVVSGVKVNS